MKKIYYGGDIITMGESREYPEAILVDDVKIAKVGALSEIEEYVNDNKFEVERIHLNGKTLIPSFIDSHSHISMLAQFAFMADLSECESFDEIKNTLKEYKKENNLNEDDPIVAFGYDQNFLKEGKRLTKSVLNEVSMTNPIFVLHTSTHMGCANDMALKIANIDKDTKDPDGGIIGREEGGFEVNGYLEESAMMMVLDKISKIIKMNFNELVIPAQDQYIKNGITTVQDGGSTPEIIALLKGLADNNLLKVDDVAFPTMKQNPRKIKEENYDITNKYYNRL